jgi:DNA polymerase I
LKLRFWLLDVNYETKDATPELWMWGIDTAGTRVLIIDRNFRTYFYLVLKENTSPRKLIKEIQGRKTEFPLILKTEQVKRKYFGKPVNALKITVENPDIMSKYGKILRKLEGIEQCLEDDIHFSMRYLIDNDVSPCEWHEIEVEQTETNVRVQTDNVYLAKSFPERIERMEVPKLRMLGFSIICYSKRGMPKPNKNPVAIISVATNSGDEEQFVAENLDDKVVVADFVSFVRQINPDILVGFGTNRQDWPYLIQRARKLGLKLHVDRVETEPHTSVYGHVSVTGRANIDLFDFTDELPEIKLKTLENVADYLDVMKLEKRTIIEDIEYASYWEDEEKRPTLLKYSKENARCIIGITEALLDFAMQLSSLVSLPLDHVGTAAVGFRIEWYLMKKAQKIGELIPKRTQRPYIPYKGGIVLEPKIGLHENVAVLDFKAMYPNLMITCNISPDTYLSSKESDPLSGVNVAPKTKHRFRKEPAGFYKEILSNLIDERDTIKAKLEKLDPKSLEYCVLDARQKAVKVITNAAYGYAGWIGARWYVKPVAEAAADWGRHTIQETIEIAKEIGLEVVYGDTDSIFIKYESEKAARLARKIENMFGLEVKPDKIYVRILFTEAKKRYCGLLPNGQLDIVGLEVIRGDWADVARKSQEKVLEILLKEESPKKAVQFVHRYIADLQAKKAPYKDLIIWKALTKPIEKYAVKAPHVEAAKILRKEGWEISAGDKVGYVITSGTGRLYTRVKPFMLASYEDVDVEYYVTHQVVPAVARILKVFGVKEEELVPSPKQEILTDFFDDQL